MKTKTKKTLYIIALILIGLLFAVAVCLIIFSDKDATKITGVISSTITATIEASLAVTLHFNININKTINAIVDKHIENISNEYRIRLEHYESKMNTINNISNTNSFKVQKINQVLIPQHIGTKNHDDELLEEVDKIFQPIEEYRQKFGGFSVKYKTDIFYALCAFADNCTMSYYYFGNSQLDKIFEKLKIEAVRLAKLMEVYSYTTENDPNYSELKTLIVRRNIQLQKAYYSPAEIKEYDEAFSNACEMLNNLVDLYKELVLAYRKLNY